MFVYQGIQFSVKLVKHSVLVLYCLVLYCIVVEVHTRQNFTIIVSVYFNLRYILYLITIINEYVITKNIRRI